MRDYELFGRGRADFVQTSAGEQFIGFHSSHPPPMIRDAGAKHLKDDLNLTVLQVLAPWIIGWLMEKSEVSIRDSTLESSVHAWGVFPLSGFCSEPRHSYPMLVGLSDTEMV